MSLSAEAQIILENLSLMSFEQCYRLSRRFEAIPTNPGLYAVRHRIDGVLYLGKSINLRKRFRDGHKALSWAFVDRYDADDVRIAVEIFGNQSWQRAGDLEILMIRMSQPSYNSLIK